jgi:hypothetical protein
MKNRDDSLTWIPLWVDKWIFGSTRIELQPDERAVWTDFMALAAKDSGWIRANLETPYPLEQLAGLLCISKELLERSIKRFIETKKIEIVDGSAGFHLINWDDYALSDDYKTRIAKKGYGYWKHSDNHGTPSEKSVTIEENRREEKRILEKNSTTFPQNHVEKPSLMVECKFCGQPFGVKEEHKCKS